MGCGSVRCLLFDMLLILISIVSPTEVNDLVLGVHLNSVNVGEEMQRESGVICYRAHDQDFSSSSYEL